MDDDAENHANKASWERMSHKYAEFSRTLAPIPPVAGYAFAIHRAIEDFLNILEDEDATELRAQIAYWKIIGIFLAPFAVIFAALLIWGASMAFS